MGPEVPAVENPRPVHRHWMRGDHDLLLLLIGMAMSPRWPCRCCRCGHEGRYVASVLVVAAVTLIVRPICTWEVIPPVKVATTRQ